MTVDDIKGEGTFQSINLDDFYKNQNNPIESFGICPDCEKETLKLSDRTCPCGYNLEHKTPKITNNIKTNVENTINNKNSDRFCGCGEKIIGNYAMCKYCAWKSKI